ncbi:MAG TPA: sugar ABC transporter permease, partial [Ruminiclostridium sp.]
MRNLKIKKQLPLHLMMLPGLILLLIFHYLPMAGIVIAFQKFIPAKGLFGPQKWIGLENFRYVLDLPNIYSVIWNTVSIAVLKIVLALVIPIIIAILINEVTNNALKRSVQTLIYLPHFLSWVVLGGILIDI